jgi:hypothetical protein
VGIASLARDDRRRARAAASVASNLGRTVVRSPRLACLLLVAVLAAPVASAEPPPPKDWELALMPYGWVPALDASVKTRHGREHYHLDIDDVLENLDIAAMGRVTGRWHRWVGVLDAVWAQFEENDAFERRLLQVHADMRQTFTFVQLLGGYRLYSRPGGLFGHATAGDERSFALDALAGVNYTYVSASLELDRAPLGPFPGRDRNFGNNSDWFAPTAGLRVQNDFTSRLRLETLASVGGFGVGDAPQLSWMVTTLLSYRFTDHWVAAVGHRVIRADNNDNDVKMNGPMIGVGYRF